MDVDIQVVMDELCSKIAEQAAEIAIKEAYIKKLEAQLKPKEGKDESTVQANT